MQEQTYTCNKCDAEFPTEQALQEHNNQQHTGEEEQEEGI